MQSLNMRFLLLYKNMVINFYILLIQVWNYIKLSITLLIFVYNVEYIFIYLYQLDRDIFILFFYNWINLSI